MPGLGQSLNEEEIILAPILFGVVINNISPTPGRTHLNKAKDSAILCQTRTVAALHKHPFKERNCKSPLDLDHVMYSLWSLICLLALIPDQSVAARSISRCQTKGI